MSLSAAELLRDDESPKPADDTTSLAADPYPPALSDREWAHCLCTLDDDAAALSPALRAEVVANLPRPPQSSSHWMR